MSKHEIESKVRDLRQLQTLMDESQTEIGIIEDAIKAHMGDQEESRAGEHLVTWKAAKSARIDTSAPRKALPDVAEAFNRETTVRRLCVA